MAVLLGFRQAALGQLLQRFLAAVGLGKAEGQQPAGGYQGGIEPQRLAQRGDGPIQATQLQLAHPGQEPARGVVAAQFRLHQGQGLIRSACCQQMPDPAMAGRPRRKPLGQPGSEALLSQLRLPVEHGENLHPQGPRLVGDGARSFRLPQQALHFHLDRSG